MGWGGVGLGRFVRLLAQRHLLAAGLAAYPVPTDGVGALGVHDVIVRPTTDYGPGIHGRRILQAPGGTSTIQFFG